MMDCETEKVVSNLRAVLLSTQGAVPVNSVGREYRLLVGQPIPYKKLGFNSLESFLGSISSLRLIKRNNELFLDAIPTENTQHLADLVAQQRHAHKKSKSHKNSVPKKPPWKFRTPNQIVPNSKASSQGYRWKAPPRFARSAAVQESNSRVTSPEFDTDSTLVDEEGAVDCTLSDKLADLTLEEFNDSAVETSKEESILENSSEDNTNSAFLARLAHFKVPNPPPRHSAESGTQENGVQSALNARLAHFFHDSPSPNATIDLFSNDMAHSQDFGSASLGCDQNSAFHKRLAHFSSGVQQKDPLNGVCSNIYVLEGGRNDNVETYLSLLTPETKGKVLSKPPGLSSSAVELPNKPYIQMMDKYQGGLISQPGSAVYSQASSMFGHPVKNKQMQNFASQIPSQATSFQTPFSASIAQTPSSTSVSAGSNGICNNQFGTNFSAHLNENPSTAHSLTYGMDRSSGTVSPESDVSTHLASFDTRSTNSPMPTLDFLESERMQFLDAQERNVLTNSLSSSCSPSISPECQITIPDLILPQEDIWNVYIVHVVTSQEIWVNIIGKKYSDLFDSMAVRMELYYCTSAVEATSYKIRCCYALQLNSCWQRVRLEDISGEEACVFLVDQGIQQKCFLSELYVLEQNFTLVPAQAVCVSLYGLEDFVNEPSINSILGDCVGKTFVAEVVHRDPKTSLISVTLCDISSGQDVILNHLLTEDARLDLIDV